ncbi:heparinase II/III family protein [Vallitalea guaymasensis]|uniref:heparinase II/III family protein n=1 Tax=Vallitalea guaymasensis TaxID=1185412 RepID=UPI000DE336D7|nr:heparinase II/III family protein [Vallitalea guaymasensis]
MRHYDLNQIRESFKEINKKNIACRKRNLKYLQKEYPDIYAGLIDRANKYRDGYILLPGTGGDYIHIGNPPNWFDNIVSDNEYIWQLNRMKYWFTLIDAYIILEDETYITKVINDMDNWLKVCNPPESYDTKLYNKVDPWRILEVGIRMQEAWGYFVEMLISTQVITDKLLEKLIESIHRHGEILYRVSPKKHPGAATNHYIMEMLGLLWVGNTFKQFEEADEWKAFAISELERCSKAQLTIDGAHVEGCPMYHNGAVKWFSTGVIFAGGTNHFSTDYVDRLRKSLCYSIYSFRPTGTTVPWGDSRANTAAILGALYGYIVFNHVGYLSSIRKFISINQIADLLVNHLRYINDIEKLLMEIEEASKDYTIQMDNLNWQRDINQVMYRTGWDKSDLSIFFACNAPIVSNHAHMDLMGFDLTCNERPLVVDPGVFTYRDCNERYTFKSSQWHNTLTINNKDHFKYLTSFSYEKQKAGYVINTDAHEKLWYVVARHHNYEPIIHTRLMSLVDKKIIVILDKVEHLNPEDTVQLHYHLDSTKIKEQKGVVYTDQSDSNISIYYDENNFKRELIKGAISDEIDCLRESTLLQLNSTNPLVGETIFHTIMIPKVSSELSNVHVNIKQDNSRIMCIIEVDDSVYTLIWKDNICSIDM